MNEAMIDCLQDSYEEALDIRNNLDNVIRQIEMILNYYYSSVE